jgi:ABC-2 type transport system permease protein
MTAPSHLFRHDLASIRRPMLWWSVGLLSLSLVNVAFWPSLEDSEAMKAFDDMGSLLEAFGAQNMGTPTGYLDGQMYALLLPLLLTGMAVAWVSGRTAGEEEAGRLEVLLSLPVSRPLVWLVRWCAAMVGLVLVAGAVGAFVVLSRPLFSLDEVRPGAVAAASAGCIVLAALAASVSYAAAGLGARRGLSAGAAVTVTVTSYVMAYLAPLSERFEWLRSWSPWHWALGEQPVSEGVALGPAAVVVAMTALLVVVGTVGVGRRDVRTP